MKLVALFLTAVIAPLALSCDTQQPVAPVPAISLHKTASAATDASCLDVVNRKKHGEKKHADKNGPLVLLCAIQAPGPQPLTQGQKGWVDGHNYYLADQSNAGLDVFDADALAFVGRVGGMLGNLPAAGGTATTNGPGPSSVVLDKRGRAWVSDGNSTVYVIDVNHMQIIATINTSKAACDRGTASTHYCGRENEITYDPEHDLIFTQNPSPLDTAAPHNAIDTYATFISARPPYSIVGTISFPDRRGQEAPLWDQKTHRILTAVSGRQVVTGTAVTALFHQYVAVINPKVHPFTVEKQFTIDCTALGIVGAITPANPTGRQFGINDPTLEPHQNMVIPACGRPIIMDAVTGTFVNSGITQVAGGNETTYGSDDGNFYTAVGNVLGVIDARSAQWLQNVPDTGGANPAAYGERNRIFTIVSASTTTRTACTLFGPPPLGYQATGCITVFGHEGEGGKGDKDDD
jgi:hypothetical protein